MKTNIKILLVLVSSIIISNKSNAQLKVRTDGTVKIGTQSPLPQGGMLEITGINQTLEARIFSSSANISRFWTINSVFAFGFGIDQNGLGQIFRNINSPSSIMTFNSNGDFGIGRTPSYKLDVNGNIRVNTTIYTSDSLLKSNITPILKESSKIYKLRGISYNYNNSLLSDENIVQTETMNPNKQIGKKVEYDKRIHYGFVAQEVKKIYPELVYKDNNGILGIDYVAFIPLLVEELKKQNEVIKSLKQDINALKEMSYSNFLPTIKDTSNGELFQNIPNPFNENTTIKFKVLNSVNSATLCLYDLQGKQIKSFAINQRGESSITIEGSELNPGLYFYSLIADGKIIDTKLMVLTN
ncbi:MAG: tail fiber domain-containing protein [Bacteroidia bacterium]|nr:tail fiber domain-containing protein [Bacteroidia bacterium]